MLEDGKLLMKFNIGVNLAGKPYGWNVDNVDASRCEIKLGGKIRIASYCSIIEREYSVDGRRRTGKEVRPEVASCTILLSQTADNGKPHHGT